MGLTGHSMCVVFVGLTIGFQAGVVAEAIEPDAVTKLDFREPFSPLTGTEMQSSLVVMLITNDDPYRWKAAQALDLENEDGRRANRGVPDVWCGGDFRRAFRKMLIARPDLNDRCVLQRVVAGLPAALRNGKVDVTPRRVMVAICDGSYRLLHFCVGLPDSDELLQLIEDAQETKALLALSDQELKPEVAGELAENEEKSVGFGKRIWDRSEKRVRRSYRELIFKITQQDPWNDELVTIDDEWINRFAEKMRQLEPMYLFDAQLRFGLSDTVDRIRLVVLEQHLEARANWCECVAPFVAGRPLQEILSSLVDVVWNVTPVVDINPEFHRELLEWVEIRKENSTIVFAVKPNLLLEDVQWPPPNVSGRTVVKNSWQDLEALMAGHSFRTIDLEQLAVVLAESKEGPLDAFSPSRVRYVVFPADKRPYAIRESDLPVKFMQRLKTETEASGR